MPDEKDVKQSESSAGKDGVDERGVPTHNRIRELERKLADAEARLSQYSVETETPEEPKVDTSQLSKQELQKSNPRTSINSSNLGCGYSFRLNNSLSIGGGAH